MSTEIHVEATSCDSLHLKIVDQMPLPPVSLSQVPILLTREPIIEENSASFLQYIDGITTLGQITEISGMNVSDIIPICQNLGKLKILSFIEEFSVSGNNYSFLADLDYSTFQSLPKTLHLFA